MEEFVEDFAGPLAAIIGSDMKARAIGLAVEGVGAPTKLPAGVYTIMLSRGAPEARFMSPAVSRNGGMALQGRSEDDASGSESGGGRPKVRGIASSTSVDWYGTEMSRECLEDMRDQFAKGVAYLPRHRDGWTMLEWNRQYGVSVGAELEDRDVVDQHPDSKESPCVLWVESDLWEDLEGADETNKLAKELRSRLERGQAIGQSIGGHFREVVYTVDEEGWIARIVINKVDLDHLATTRSPANPDSTGLQVVRSKLGAIFEKPPATEPSEPENPAQRSVAPDVPLAPASGVDNTPASPTSTELSQEPAMTPEEKAALIAELRTALVADIRSVVIELATPATPVTPVAAPAPATPDKNAEIERVLGDLQRSVNELSQRSQPVGAGPGGQPAPQERTPINRPEDLIERAKSVGGPAAKFAETVERAKGNVFVDSTDRTSPEFAKAVRSAPATLAAILDAAHRSGLVKLDSDAAVGI